MSLLTIVWLTIKRIISNWRLEAALLTGLILAVGIISSIPIYSTASLQQSMVRSWVAQDSFRPPFAVIVTHRNTYQKLDVDRKKLLRLRSFLDTELSGRLKERLTSFSEFSSLGSNYFLRSDNEATFTSPRAEVTEMSNLKELGEIIDGRWYAPRTDGVVEAVVDVNTLEKNELIVGHRYFYHYPIRKEGGYGPPGKEEVVIPIEIVGLFRAKAGYTTEDWIYPPPFFGRVFVDPDVYHQRFLDELDLRVNSYDLQWVFDYTGVRVDELPRLIAGLDSIEARVGDVLPETRFWYAPTEFLRSFNEKAQRISRFLLALSVPILGMVLYYVLLMAGIAVERRQGEMTVMQSRGAGRTQIAVSFLLEWLLLGLVAVALGPYIGLLIAALMGASAGFLSFVGREALPVAISSQAYTFSIVAVVAALGAAMVPAVSASRLSIVQFKQEQVRKPRRSVWHRLYIDIILLAVAYFSYRDLWWESVSVAPGATVPADPVLFFAPALFLLGAGLLILRVYPWVMSLLSWITKRLRGVTLQLTFRHVSRNAGEYVPLLLLLIMTISLGIYSASTARTLTLNFEDRIHYEVGADLAITESWQRPGGGGGGAVSEPPFLKREEIPGVEAAARVLTRNVRVTDESRYLGSGRMMALVPYEFARTAWYRRDLSEAHFYDYLKLLRRHPEGALVYSGFARRQHLSLGDTLTLEYKGQPVKVYVAGTVDYWPTLNPYEHPFFIVNLPYVLENIALEPYDTWYKLSEPGHVQDVVDALMGLGVYATEVRDAHSEVVDQRNEPYRKGFFGVLSTGFLTAAAITVLGFLVYTFFSIRSRILQFGVLRAIGLSLYQLIVILGLEQLLTLGVGLGVGTGLGLWATQMFLPFLRERASEVASVPPFIIATDPADLTRIFTVLGVIFVVAVVGLSIILTRLKLHQALKLGEEN